MSERHEGAPQQSWESLSQDERDFFENPHYFQNTSGSYSQRAQEVLARLDDAGKAQAISSLEGSIKTLKTHERDYPVEAQTLLNDLNTK